MKKIIRVGTGKYNRSTIRGFFELPAEERNRLARAKVIEELLEVEENPCLEELGDLLEAVFLLGITCGYSESAIFRAREEKRTAKGPMLLVFEQWEETENDIRE